MENKLISIIIPSFNEKDSIPDCLLSLREQSYKPVEIIIVDDGSTDGSDKIAKKLCDIFLRQDHQGPGIARNRGAKAAKGEILVFVDSDMTFDKNFIKNLIAPILDKNSIGTFSKDEFLLNKDNAWAVCWNINRGAPYDKMHPQNYPDTQDVFRAILKSEFDKVGGFDSTGYADDWTLSRKLGVKATVAKNASFYHKNPSNLKEVYSQARWFGKNEFLTGNIIRKIYNLFRYSFPASIINGVITSIKHSELKFIIFKIVFDLAVFRSIFGSFLNEKKYK